MSVVNFETPALWGPTDDKGKGKGKGKGKAKADADAAKGKGKAVTPPTDDTDDFHDALADIPVDPGAAGPSQTPAGGAAKGKGKAVTPPTDDTDDFLDALADIPVDPGAAGPSQTPAGGKRLDNLQDIATLPVVNNAAVDDDQGTTASDNDGDSLVDPETVKKLENINQVKDQLERAFPLVTPKHTINFTDGEVDFSRILSNITQKVGETHIPRVPDNESILQELSRLKARYETLIKQQADLASQKAELLKRLNDAQTEHERMVADLNGGLHKLTAESQQALQENARLKNENEALENKRRELEEIIAGLRTKRHGDLDELSVMRKELDETNTKLAECKKQTNNDEQAIGLKNEEIEQLTKQLSTDMSLIEALSVLANRLLDIVSEMAANLERRNKLLQDLEASLTKNDGRIIDLVSNISAALTMKSKTGPEINELRTGMNIGVDDEGWFYTTDASKHFDENSPEFRALVGRVRRIVNDPADDEKRLSAYIKEHQDEFLNLFNI